MPVDPRTTPIYHITDIGNLDAIIRAGGLHSDAALVGAGARPAQIGYADIKYRRLNEYRIGCCNNRFVGEFVPFYFCPRSPMLYTVNNGNTGRAVGCQSDILHLVSNAFAGASLGRQWAVSDGNAGSAYTTFTNAADSLEGVNWTIVNSNNWAGARIHAKATEFLVADFFPVEALTSIGCQNAQTAAAAQAILAQHNLPLRVNVHPNWYY